MHSEFSTYLQDTDSKALARIDEILARSRKVVEESMELSKKTIDHKPVPEILIDTPKSSENSLFLPKRPKSKASNPSPEVDFEHFSESNAEKTLDDLNKKINSLQTKAAEDEAKIEFLKQKINSEKLSKANSELNQADNLIQSLKETLAVGLVEENKKLRIEIETVLKKKSAEEIRLSKELEEVIKERKVLEVQYNNLKYLYDHSPNYAEEMQEAKLALERIEQQSIDTIKLLEIRIQEQENENFRMREAIKNPNQENLNIIRVRFEDQAKQNYKFLKKLKSNY